MNDSAPIEEEQILVGRYKILGRLGSGAIGAVYKARDIILKRDVAIKLLSSGSSRTHEQLVRLQREARAICQLKHPNIIDVYDLVVGEGNVPILAMEFAEGESLDDFLKREGSIEPLTAALIFEQIASALAYAHERHIMHRDLKPGNILVQSKKQFEVKIIDFGIAKLLDEDGSLTSSGMIVGTPSYISPEQARNDNVDYRSDIYSLGCLMYKTLTGRAAFRGATVIETLQAQIHEEPPTLKEGNPELNFPDKFEQIVAKALKKDPDARFQTMDELAKALKTLRPSAPEQDNNEQDVSVIGPPKGGNIILPMILLAVLILITGVGVFVYISSLEASVRPDADIKREELEMLRRANHIDAYTVATRAWHRPDSKVITDEQLKVLSSLDVKRLSLAKTSITDDQLNLITDLPLVSLDIRDTNISNKGIEIICSKMKGLQGLLIERCPNIDHVGYRATSQATNLRVLSLRDTNVSDQDLDEISKLTNLYVFYVAHSANITDSAIDRILKLKKLYAVRVDGTKITPAGIDRLKVLPWLLFIGMSKLNLTDETMPKSFSDGITMLDLSDNPVSLEGIAGALKLSDLWYLDVRNCLPLNKSRKNVEVLESRFRRQQGRVVLTNRELGLDTPEYYLDPELYVDNMPLWSVKRRIEMIDDAYGDYDNLGKR